MAVISVLKDNAVFELKVGENMMNQVYKTLPDDRPITSICVVEDLEKCPKGYVAVARTHDQDADADLWRDSGFFGKKCTRYLCLSKTEGIGNYVVESLIIINEKDMPPKGFSATTLTFDTAQKAWRKKQLCFKYAFNGTASTAVTDIIVLSRMKKAPEEFTLLGEINGITICYKMGKCVTENGLSLNQSSLFSYGLYPNTQSSYTAVTFPNGNYQNIITSTNTNSGPSNSGNTSSNNVNPLIPRRPAPKPPTSYATISGYSGLEGVPFILNPKWNFTNGNNEPFFPKPKTRSEIDYEYSYEFRTERET